MNENISLFYPDRPAFYKMTLKDGRYYVGSTNRLAKRLRDHRSYLRAGTHQNRHLQDGWTNWDDITIEYHEYQYPQIAKSHEQEFINENYADPLLCNIATDVNSFWGGKHGKPDAVTQRTIDKLKNYKHTDEFKEKCRLRMLGSTMSEEQRLKISQALIGRQMTDDHRASLSKALKGKGAGRKASPEAIENMRRAQLGRTMHDDAKRKIAEANFKKVSVDGIEYKSLQDCALAFGVTHTTVTNRVKSDKPRWVNWKLI